MNRKSEWTTAEMGDLSGQVAVVTGANSGIGFETARALLRHGAHVVLACRNESRGQAALDRLKADHPTSTAELMLLDVSSLASVRDFAAAFNEGFAQLDLLINNAGIMMVPEGTTDDGFELQFGTNHLGHFALTGLLLDRLAAAPNARVVSVSSLAHAWRAFDLEDPMFEAKRYSRVAAYGHSKMANLLFAYELDRRLKSIDSTTISVAAHPGATESELGDHLLARWHLGFLRPILSAPLQTTEAGAMPTLRAATDPALVGGEFIGPNGFQEFRGPPVIVDSTAASHDPITGQQLWDLSEELTGVSFLPQ